MLRFSHFLGQDLGSQAWSRLISRLGAIDKIAGLDTRHVGYRSGHGGDSFGHGGDSFGQRLNL